MQEDGKRAVRSNQYGIDTSAGLGGVRRVEMRGVFKVPLFSAGYAFLKAVCGGGLLIRAGKLANFVMGELSC